MVIIRSRFSPRVSANCFGGCGWEVIPLGHAKRLGQLNVIHGEILTGIGNQGGTFPSRKAVELYGGNILAGHTHSPQSNTKISSVEQKKKHSAGLIRSWAQPIQTTFATVPRHGSTVSRSSSYTRRMASSISIPSSSLMAGSHTVGEFTRRSLSRRLSRT